MPTRMLKLAALASLAAQPIRAEQAPDFAPYPMADGAAEVALARTAAPRHVSDSATVLVLTRNGFVEAARGTNGFPCLVLRSFAGTIGDPDSPVLVLLIPVRQWSDGTPAILDAGH